MKKCNLFSRILAVAMVLTMALCILPTMAFAATEELDYSDMVSDTILSGGAAVSKNLITFQFLYGDFDAEDAEMKTFTKYEGDGDRGADDALLDSDSPNLSSCKNGLWRWQWRCYANIDTVLKITAKEDLQMTVYPRQDEGNQWADFSSYRFIAEDDEGLRLNVKRADVTATMTVDQMRLTIHMEKGDTLYIVYSIMDGNPNTATSSYYPLFSIDTASYDAAQRPAFDTVNAVEQLKLDKAAELQTKLSQLLGDGSAYSTSRRLEMTDLVESAVKDMKELSTEEEILAVFNTAVDALQAIPTLAKEKEELDNYKAQEKAKIAAEYPKSNYTKENWAKVEAELNKLNAAIDEAESAAVINSQIARAKVALKQIPVGGNDGPDLTLILIIAGAVVAVAAIAAVVIILIKKNRKEN